MKEITRIHIAKISYDIEITAKKELETYIKALEAYSGDAEITQDVEIRMTEILADRGIKRRSVISEGDIKALKEQLGEPHEFGEGDISIGSDTDVHTGESSTKKLYRDPDNAVFGGVLSGIAAFFQVNPLWVRLIFIIVAFASFGTALLIYIVLWIAVPSAKTAADKLQMSGRPVTISSIREFNENEATKNLKSGPDSRTVMMRLLGILGIFGALGAFCMTAFVGFAGALHRDSFVTSAGSDNSGLLIAAFIFAVVSGLLLTILCSLAAVAFFTQKLTRRIIISGCVVIVLGIVSFSTAIGLVQYANFRYGRSIIQNTHTSSVLLPTETKSIRALSVIGEGVVVDYHVTNDQPSGYLRIVDEKGNMPKIVTTINDGELQVAISGVDNHNSCALPWSCGGLQKTLVIYGPALSLITEGENSSLAYHADSQPELKATLKKSSNMTIKNGEVEHLQINASDDVSVVASNATTSRVDIKVKADTRIELGTVFALAIVDENSCPSGSSARIVAWNVSGSLTVNGMSQPVKSANFACSKLSISSKEEE